MKVLNNSRIASLVLAMTVLLVFTGCGKKDIEKSEFKQLILTQAQEENAKIATEPIDEMDLELQITIPAQFKAQNNAVDRIYSPIDGKVTEVYVEPGAILKKGDPIVQIKSDDISQIQLEFLEKVIELDGSIGEMNAQYELSRQNFNRENILYKEKISSRAEYELANAQMKKDAANLNALRTKRSALVKVYQQRLTLYGGGSIETVLKTRRIYPFVTLRANKNGILLERKVNPGEIVEKNRELFNLADLSTIWLTGYAFEKDSQSLSVGQEVAGAIEDTKNKSVKGVLSYVSPILDSVTKTLEVRADIPNPDFSIKPNMYAEMFVTTGSARVLAMPNDAVEKYGDYYFVYVKVKPHTYEERKVTIGRKNEKYSEILSGVKLGEEVVTTGSFALLGEGIKQQESN
ncbi:MAG: efflux RND transporter periplasmic adaptor subunit [Heliobacteriaceae bacterium]|jgi:cobalt-zinc-cadmium efflux system membrane fusion protein|nr:efflux RND transporter periplasmic adaptor subunit [Heliobacteriaceae bacterium]